MTKDDFKKTIARFIENTKMSATALGLSAANNPKFVFDVQNGRECREATQERVLDFMRNYAKDKGIEWEY